MQELTPFVVASKITKDVPDAQTSGDALPLEAFQDFVGTMNPDRYYPEHPEEAPGYWTLDPEGGRPVGRPRQAA